MTVVLTPPGTPHGTTRRRMGHLENYYSRRGLTIRLAIVTTGLDIARMQRAFTTLTATHCALRAHVADYGDDRLFDVADLAILPFTAGPGDPDAFADELASPLPLERHLASLDIVHQRERAAVALTVAHNIADVRGVAYLLRELWDTYDSDTSPDGRWHRQLPQRAEHWIDPQRAPAMPSPLAGEFLTPATPMSGAASTRRRLHFDMGEDTTTALRRNARAAGTTAHGAIAGAVLAAERELIDRPGKLPMALRTSVDLRPRLTPTVHPLDATPMLGQVMTQTHIGTSDSPLHIGHTVTDTIDRRVADQSALYSSVQPTDTYRPPISYVVNAGVLPTLPTPVAEIRLGISRHVPYKAPTYAAYTYNGNLNIDTIAPSEAIAESEHRHLTELIEHHLTTLAAP